MFWTIIRKSGYMMERQGTIIKRAPGRQTAFVENLFAGRRARMGLPGFELRTIVFVIALFFLCCGWCRGFEIRKKEQYQLFKFLEHRYLAGKHVESPEDELMKLRRLKWKRLFINPDSRLKVSRKHYWYIEDRFESRFFKNWWFGRFVLFYQPAGVSIPAPEATLAVEKSSSAALVIKGPGEPRTWYFDKKNGMKVKRYNYEESAPVLKKLVGGTLVGILSQEDALEYSKLMIRLFDGGDAVFMKSIKDYPGAGKLYYETGSGRVKVGDAMKKGGVGSPHVRIFKKPGVKRFKVTVFTRQLLSPVHLGPEAAKWTFLVSGNGSFKMEKRVIIDPEYIRAKPEKEWIIPAQTAGVKLTGIYKSGNVLRAVLVSTNSGRSYNVKAGESVGAWKIISVSKNRVVLKSGAYKIIMNLRDE